MPKVNNWAWICGSFTHTFSLSILHLIAFPSSALLIHFTTHSPSKPILFPYLIHFLDIPSFHVYSPAPCLSTSTILSGGVAPVMASRASPSRIDPRWRALTAHPAMTRMISLTRSRSVCPRRLTPTRTPQLKSIRNARSKRSFWPSRTSTPLLLDTLPRRCPNPGMSFSTIPMITGCFSSYQSLSICVFNTEY